MLRLSLRCLVVPHRLALQGLAVNQLKSKETILIERLIS